MNEGSYNDELDHSQNDVGAVAAKKKEPEAIAKKEDKMVTVLKGLVLLVLVVSAVGVALTVHAYMKGKEDNEFRGQFNSDAHKVLEAIGNNLDAMLGATDATAIKVVSYVKNSPGMEWPFVTIPDFSIQALKMLRLSNSIFVGFHIVVDQVRLCDDSRLLWRRSKR